MRFMINKNKIHFQCKEALFLLKLTIVLRKLLSINLVTQSRIIIGFTLCFTPLYPTKSPNLNFSFFFVLSIFLTVIFFSLHLQLTFDFYFK